MTEPLAFETLEDLVGYFSLFSSSMLSDAWPETFARPTEVFVAITPERSVRHVVWPAFSYVTTTATESYRPSE